jgi:hypothetical protein
VQNKCNKYVKKASKRRFPDVDLVACFLEQATEGASRKAERRRLMAKGKRVNVNFSDGAYDDLESIADQQGKSKAEVLRDAIALERLFQDAKREGARLLIERDGEIREIIPR